MSSHQDRDRSTDALLRASLPGLPAGDASACVDAETMAAWSERTLPSADASRVDAHLAGCARCQAMLAAFVRTEPEAAAAQPFWQRWPAMKWLVPTAALAGTVVIIAVVTRETTPVPIQMARQEAPSVSSAPPVSAPARDLAIAPAEPAPTVRQEARQVASSPKSEAFSRTADQAAGNVARADRESRANEAVAGARLPAPLAAAAPPPPTVPSAPSLAQEPLRKVEGTQERQAADQADAQTSTKLDSVQVTNLPLNSYRNYQSLVVLVPGTPPDTGAAGPQRTVSVVVEIVSAPRPAFARASSRGGVGRGRAGAAEAAEAASAASKLPATIPARWRILSGGLVERSANGGATWRAVTVDAPVPVGGGTSPSDLVCWLIGPGGVVLLSTDGLRFERRPFPDKADLVSITAADDREATVMTADGRTFVTFDGGASWTRRQP